MQERLLIISNNVLSYTDNNGKTILSYFDSLPKQSVHQLYFNSDMPSVKEYSYFQLSDKDIIKGYFLPAKRGRAVQCVEAKEVRPINYTSSETYGDGLRLIRELLWHRHWKSKQLIDWLDGYKPTTIFFVAGDSGFAYEIVDIIQKKYNARLAIYITDDYLQKRKEENIIHGIRRKNLLKHAKYLVNKCDVFVTISEPMRRSYRELFHKDSILAVNMVEDLRKDTSENNTMIEMTYAGSLYYGRAKILGGISKEIALYNSKTAGKKAILRIYSNCAPSSEQRSELELNDYCEYKGSLNKTELIDRMNASDIFVFVESFEEKQKEKTTMSLSTKIPEYLSMGKPILAIGPAEIGSMNYLKEVAACVTEDSQEALYEQLSRLLDDEEFRQALGKKGYHKFLTNHTKKSKQMEFQKAIFGKEYVV